MEPEGRDAFGGVAAVCCDFFLMNTAKNYVLKL